MRSTASQLVSRRWATGVWSCSNTPSPCVLPPAAWTIRRDLRELAAQGLLQRVHGGALPASPATGDTLARANIGSQDNADLGKLGASLVNAGQVVLPDGKTTALQIAKHLPRSLHATVVTHSPEVACALAAHSKLDVIMLGGKLFRHSMVNMGAQTLQAVAQMHIDLFFMGVTGAHLQAGLTTSDYEEAALKRALHAQAAETVVLASPEKLGAASALSYRPFERYLHPRPLPCAQCGLAKCCYSVGD